MAPTIFLTVLKEVFPPFLLLFTSALGYGGFCPSPHEDIFLVPTVSLHFLTIIVHCCSAASLPVEQLIHGPPPLVRIRITFPAPTCSLSLCFFFLLSLWAPVSPLPDPSGTSGCFYLCLPPLLPCLEFFYFIFLCPQLQCPLHLLYPSQLLSYLSLFPLRLVFHIFKDKEHCVGIWWLRGWQQPY